jgi:D-tyrosyl-tRNA(Tyr) deacylase
MRALVQRVLKAKVEVDGQVVGQCGHGLLVLLGVGHDDTAQTAERMWRKISRLRIFCDDAGKMNRSLIDVGGEMLVVSNFTLLAAYKKGNRPDYMGAAAPDEANELYEYFADNCQMFVPVGKGVFGADMRVDIVNDGPVTIVMDSKVLLGTQKP